MDDQQNDIYPSEYRAAQKAQATALKVEASEHGLRMETYLVPSVAEWVLTLVERGRFLDPSEAVFAAMQVLMELDAYPDLQEELFRREITNRLNDDGPTIPGDEAFAKLKERVKQRTEREPPTWVKVPYPS
jgi:Arc/MetJ-type ribon-helix-helix transcriptional regulator